MSTDYAAHFYHILLMEEMYYVYETSNRGPKQERHCTERQIIIEKQKFFINNDTPNFVKILLAGFDQFSTYHNPELGSPEFKRYTDNIRRLALPKALRHFFKYSKTHSTPCLRQALYNSETARLDRTEPYQKAKLLSLRDPHMGSKRPAVPKWREWDTRILSGPTAIVYKIPSKKQDPRIVSDATAFVYKIPPTQANCTSPPEQDAAKKEEEKK